MKLEAIKPARRCFSMCGKTSKDLVSLDTPIVTDLDRRRINERNTGAFSSTQH
jgi:hypothetical protein